MENYLSTLSEVMPKAAMNTVISMSIVFCVLILISLIINSFKMFSVMEAKRKEKESTDNQFVSQIEQREELEVQQEAEEVDDTELIAVIAAAIAASTGTSTSDFVVRSIVRR
uniref:OadG family protein n=1 Tax=Agathobacter sp. TaxID=2021311 RepID=UPI0040575D11